MDNFENIYLKHGWGFADDETLSGGGTQYLARKTIQKQQMIEN